MTDISGFATRVTFYRSASSTSTQLPSSITFIPASRARADAAACSAPGCIQMCSTPIAIASSMICSVMGGGVTIDTAWGDCGSSLKFLYATCPSTEAAEGLIAWTSRPDARRATNTLFPYFEGSRDAPATAKLSAARNLAVSFIYSPSTGLFSRGKGVAVFSQPFSSLNLFA